MSGVYIPFSEERLLAMGFKRCPPIPQTNLHPFVNILDQWEYKAIYFLRQHSDFGEQFGVIDKGDPGPTMIVNNFDELSELLAVIDAGRSISEIFRTSQQRRKIVWERMQLPADKRPALEDFRSIEIGKSHFRFAADPEVRLHLTYEQYSRAAFDYMLTDIGLFEDSADVVFTGHSVYTAIALWYMTLEAYITTLLKICCLKKGEDFHEKYKSKELHVRFGALLDLLELDKPSIYQTKIATKIREFSQFRNELMHDRHFGKEMKFELCQFSGIPIFSCQVDVLQGFLVVLETASLLRYAIAGLDTMPTVIVRDGKRVSWEKLDIAYDELLRPFFEYALEKHAMTTRLNLNYSRAEGIISPVFANGEVEGMLVVDQEPVHEIVLSDARSRRLPQLVQQYFETRQQPENTLRMAKTTLKGKANE